MISKASTFVLLLNLVTIFASFDLYQPGDVIIGQLLPVYQSSGNLKCANPDLASVIKVEALIYAANRLTNENDKLKIGYDIIDTCSETTPRARQNFAMKKWFQDAKNISSIPVAIITDLNDQREFYTLASERPRYGKHMPLISLKLRKKVWDNAYSMSPKENTPQHAILGLVRHFNWNILDVVKYNDVDGFDNFKKLSNDSDICLLNELSFRDSDLKWLKRGQKNSPVAVLFSKNNVSSFIDELPSYNLSDWNIVLGHEVSKEKHHWKRNMAGVVGIRRNYGNLNDFEKYLQTSKLLENAVMKTYCSNVTSEQCTSHKDQVIGQNIHQGASVIDAVYAVIKSFQTGSNRLPETGLTGIHVTSITGRVVSFNSDDLTRNEIMYDVVNFRTDKYVKVGKIEFNPKIKVTLSHPIAWKNERPQGRCSADCEPGTWREIWDGAEKCCWNCRACVLGTVSSFVNRNHCVKCPVGSKPTSDQSKCQPPYIDYLKWHDPFSLIMIFLLAFTVCFLVYTVNIYVKKAKTPVFLRSKSASLPLLLSLFVTFVLPVLLLMKPTISACGAYNAIFMFSLGIPLTFLIARSHVILNYCYGHDGELKRKWFKVCSPQTVISFVLIILQLIVVVIVLAAAPPNVLTTSELDVEYIECASHSRPEFLPLVFFILALIMAFNILHMSEECSPSNQNEVKFVSLGIYLMYALIFIYFVAVFGINGKKKIRVLCALSYLMGVNFLASVFLPKIYVILFKPEENLPDVSCLLKDENGNQDVSRLSRRECVGSPLLGLEAGPYDRTEV